MRKEQIITTNNKQMEEKGMKNRFIHFKKRFVPALSGALMGVMLMSTTCFAAGTGTSAVTQPLENLKTLIIAVIGAVGVIILAKNVTARQLIFSIASVVVGGGIVLLLYKYIGLTGSAYVAIPCVAPIALGGFYSFNGMNFYEYMGKKLHFMFGNRALTYVSTEGEPAIKQLEAEQNEQVKKKGRKAEPETVTADSAVKKQEEFEAMKKKTRNMLLGLVAVIVAAAAGIAAYKAMH